jgi:hypothetical protein
MSDAIIWINEPIAAEREFDVDLLNLNQTARVTGAAGAAVIKVGYLSGTIMTTDAACTLTELTGGFDFGPYRLRLSPTAVNLVGEVGYEVSVNASPWAPSTSYSATNRVTNVGNVYVCTTGGTSASSGGPTGTGTGINDNGVLWNYLGAAFATVHGSVQVRPLDCLYYGGVTAVGSNTLTLDSSNPGGSASAVTNYYANAATGRTCRVRVVAGTGLDQIRNGTAYAGSAGGYVLTIDSADPFATPLDTTSIIRIEGSPPVVLTAAGQAAIATAVLDAARSGHIILGSIGEGIALATSLLQGNFFIDNVTPTINGPTAQRLRCWLSSAAMSGVTPGGSGQGEFATFLVATTYSGPGVVVTHKVTQQ